MDVRIEVLEIILFPNIPRTGAVLHNLFYRSITSEPQADAFGRVDIAVSPVRAKGL